MRQAEISQSLSSDRFTESKTRSLNVRERFIGRCIRFGAVTLAGMAFATFMPNVGQAQITRYWSTVQAPWDSQFAWSPTGVPGPNDIAHIGSLGSVTVNWDSTTGNRNTGRLEVAAGTVLFVPNSNNPAQYALTLNSTGNALVVSGNSTTLNMTGLYFNIANGNASIANGCFLNIHGSHPKGARLRVNGLFYADGNLSFSNGAVVEDFDGYIGYGSGSNGEVLVTGANTSWSHQDQLYVGISGAGKLNIKNGGVVTNAGDGFIARAIGSTGTVLVDGNGSHWRNSRNLFLGGTATATGAPGHLNLLNGGYVHVGNDTGYDGGSDLIISDSGSGGRLLVRNGSKINNTGEGVIGWSSGYSGTATINGNGSRWDTSSSMYVGLSGNGTLNIENSGVVTNTHGFVGDQNGSTSMVKVEGNGSKWMNSTNLYLGGSATSDGGRGHLSLLSGGDVHVGNVMTSDAGSDLVVGDSGSNGILFVRNGSTITNSGDTLIGWGETNTGWVTVRGANSRLDNTGNMYVGFGGSGQMAVLDGAVVTSSFGFVGNGASSAQSYIGISGTSSRWDNTNQLSVGSHGFGRMHILDGGQVTSDRGYVGRESTATGIVVIDGIGSQWTVTDSVGFGLRVGNSGTGTLNITGGGKVLDVWGYLGIESGSIGNATISGAGSLWESSSNMYVGTGGKGTLLVSNGGEIKDIAGFIGNNAGSIISTATITGVNSRWTNTGDFTVGRFGRGVLNIESGGQVTSVNGFIGRESTGVGTVNINGMDVNGAHSKWTNSANLNVGSAGGTGSLIIDNFGMVDVSGTTKLWNNGAILIDDHGLLETGTLDLTLGSFQMLNNGMLMAEAVVGSLTNTSGILAPGHSPGVMTISGDYTQGALATLQIELGGLLLGEFDQLMIAGDATLDGLLDVSLYGNFNLGYNQWFQVGTVGGTLSGEFSSLADGDLIGNFGGIDLFIDYTRGSGGNDGIAFFTSVPEPSSTMLVLLGALACGIHRRSRKLEG